MQNFQSSDNYGYGYSSDTNNTKNKPLQPFSSVQFYDPNTNNNSNNFYQGPQNLGYSNNQNIGYSQGLNYGTTNIQNLGYSNTPLNTGYSLLNANLNFNPQSKFAQYSSNTQNLGYTGRYSSNFNQKNNFEIKQNSNNFSPVFDQILFNNVAIVSKNAKKVLDVCQDKDALGMLIIYDDYKEPNQRFNIVKNGDSVNIISVKSGKYLTVGANSQRNGAPIFQQPINGLIGQKFRLSSVGESQYLIHTFCGKVLDCCQENTSNGTRVIQWDCDRKIHQMWVINLNR